jgi:hypothetical protein
MASATKEQLVEYNQLKAKKLRESLSPEEEARYKELDPLMISGLESFLGRVGDSMRKTAEEAPELNKKAINTKAPTTGIEGVLPNFMQGKASAKKTALPELPLDPSLPKFGMGESGKFEMRNLTPELDVSKTPPSEIKESPVAKEELATVTGETPQGDTPVGIPRSPKDMTALDLKIKEMAEAYGEHGKALRSEADGLNAQLNTLRSNFQGEMAMARNDYERQRTQQQWAQVGELIGRSLITMAAAARSLQKGKNFVTGLDPRSQVDWLSQLREARADMQDKIDASKATMQMGSESAEEQSKARLAEKGLAWEGKKLSLREQIAGIKGDMQRKEQQDDQKMREQKGIEREDRSLAKQQTLAEQAAMRGRIGQESKRSVDANKALGAVLTKGLSQKEGNDREAVLKNLRETFLSAEPELQAKFDEIVRSSSNSIFPDMFEPNYDSANLGKVKGQLEDVLRESKKFKEQSTPEVTWKDYSKKWGSEGLSSDEIQAQSTESSPQVEADKPGSSKNNPARPTSKEELNALPSGTWIRNNKTGEAIQKP